MKKSSWLGHKDRLRLDFTGVHHHTGMWTDFVCYPWGCPHEPSKKTDFVDKSCGVFKNLHSTWQVNESEGTVHHLTGQIPLRTESRPCV